MNQVSGVGTCPLYAGGSGVQGPLSGIPACMKAGVNWSGTAEDEGSFVSIKEAKDFFSFPARPAMTHIPACGFRPQEEPRMHNSE